MVNKIIQFSIKVLKDTIFLGSFVLTLGQLAFILAGYAVNVGLARILGPVEYGQYGVVISLLVWLEMLLTVGFITVTTKMAAENLESANSLIKIIIKSITEFGAILIIIVAILSPYVSRLFADEKLGLLLLIAAIDLLVYGAYAVILGVQMGVRNFKQRSIMILIYSVAKIIFILGITLIGMGIKGALIGNVAASIFGLGAGIFFTKRLGKGDIDSEKLSANWKLGFPATLKSLSIMLIMSTDLWVAKVLIDDVQIGYYVAASALAKTIFHLSNGILMQVIPEVSRNAAVGDFKKAQRSVVKLLLIFGPVFLILAFCIQVFAEPLIRFIFSNVYYPAVPLLRVLLHAYFSITLCVFFSEALLALGNIWVPGVIFLWISIASFPVNIMFVKKYGAIGAAYGFELLSILGALVTGTILFLVFRQKTLDLRQKA